ncbi:MAG TPA: hypothetical protein VMT68_00945 [Caulobacteraceae bacterium]|nr:hypothetical protein [Caulobacteraceae bacterium]
MRRRDLLASLPLALAAGGAFAEGGSKQAGQYVDLSPVAMPIVVNGRLINYVFVYMRINLTPMADVVRLRDKEPYFRDALVRMAHRTPFTVATDYTRVDEPRLKASLYQAAVAIAGPGAVASVEVMPGGGPMRRTGLPKPGTPIR